MSRALPEKPAFLSTLPAERKDRRLAAAVMAVSALIFLALAPFARQPLPPVWPFMPIYESALAINDLITAGILFIQFNILRSRALLAIAAGYLFSALMAVPHALSFPGLFAPAGLLGAGPQTTAWLYMFWHSGFPVAVIAYALLKDRADAAAPAGKSVLPVLLSTVTAVVGAVTLTTLLATTGKDALPQIMEGNHYTPALIVVVSTVWLLSLTALVVLWLRSPHTVLDIWLMVVMCAWLFDIALCAVLNAGRFDLGFYAGRIYGLLASTFVLMVMLLETGALYAQLAQLFEHEHQERRREAEERRRIFETSLDLILVVDRDDNLIRVSPSSVATLGYAPSDMLGRKLADFVHADDVSAMREEMATARHGHLTRNLTARHLRRDGLLVTLAWCGVWSDPEQRHFFIGRDVTEQKRIERMKDEFIATVSHELRTPLTALAGPLALLAGGAAGELKDPAKRLVAMAHANSNRLALLINDILDIEKIEAGRMKLTYQRVDARRLVEAAIAANRALAEKFSVRVRLEHSAEEVAVRSDPDRLMQVLANLLSNAVKFSPPGEEASVSIETGGDQVRIAVRDRGPGVPEDYRALIFEKFAQIDATDTRQKGGTGLGLSIVRATMVQLGGRVGYARAPERGSIFHIEVPRWRAQTGSPAPELAVELA